MTSSLVGSEMCIRDRSFSNQTRCRASSAAPVPVTRAVSFRLGLMCVVGGAVSYTHLTLPTICSV
eukprot:8565899-Prorocentrum_lima.AAC.1